MEPTNRQIASDIATELKALNIDDRISYRWILSILKDKARTMIKQDVDSRRLLKISSIWSTINCLDMCEMDFNECVCDIPNCNVVMKSSIKIPKVFDSNYGTLVKVLTINGAKEYIQTTISGYIDIKKREVQNPNIKYFWIDNGYILIPDSKVEKVMVTGLFENPEEVDIINNPDLKCNAPLDAIFPCPGHLLDPVKTQTVLEFAKIYKGIVEDQNPNQNNNIKQ